jgi:hypothetical protein
MVSLLSILRFRYFFANLLVLFFGYIAPCLNTAKAILEQDARAVREYLTYWCVFICIVYVGRALSFFSFQKNHPPELKVVFILWLTLPRFQGALRIYSYVIKPYFEKYENDIDHHIATVTNEVQTRATRQLKVILWQLLFAPNDGVISAALLGVNSLLGNKISPWGGMLGNSMGIFGASSVSDATASASNASTATTVNLSSSSLSKKLLTEFSSMLRDGMFLEVWRGQDTQTTPCELQLMSNGKVLAISIAAGDELEELANLTSRESLAEISETPTPPIEGAADSSNDDLSNMPSRKEAFRRSRVMLKMKAEHDVKAMKVPILVVSDVSAENEDSLVVSLAVPLDALSYDACLMYANQFSSSELDMVASDRSQVSVSLLAEGLDEAEGLQVGLQILVKKARSNALRVLNKVLRVGRIPRRALSKAFGVWKQLGVGNARVVAAAHGDITFIADDNFDHSTSHITTRSRPFVTKRKQHRSIRDDSDNDDDYGMVLAEDEAGHHHYHSSTARHYDDGNEDNESLIEADMDMDEFDETVSLVGKSASGNSIEEEIIYL